MKILLNVILILLILYFLRAFFKAPQVEGARRKSAPRSGGGDQRAPAAEELIEDPHCGVYFPKSSAVTDGKGRAFCSPECRDAYGKKEG